MRSGWVLLTPCKLSSSCLEAFPNYAMSWLSPPSNELLVPKYLVNWCEISNLHKFNLEFQKYYKANSDTILRSERAATDTLKTLIYNNLVDGFLFAAIFAKKWPIRKHDF